jgi:hypothetical protein
MRRTVQFSTDLLTGREYVSGQVVHPYTTYLNTPTLSAKCSGCARRNSKIASSPSRSVVFQGNFH